MTETDRDGRGRAGAGRDGQGRAETGRAGTAALPDRAIEPPEQVPGSPAQLLEFLPAFLREEFRISREHERVSKLRHRSQSDVEIAPQLFHTALCQSLYQVGGDRERRPSGLGRKPV